MEEAILLDRHVLKLLPAHNLEWHVYLYDISSALATQFTQLRQPEDLEEAISLHRNALELLPASHPQQFTYLKGLANVLHTLEPRTGPQVQFRQSLNLELDFGSGSGKFTFKHWFRTKPWQH